MGTSQLPSRLLCLAAGWGGDFACSPPPAPALLARGTRKVSSHPVLNQQNTIRSKHTCSDVTDKLWRKYLSCLKKSLPPSLQQRPTSWLRHLSANPFWCKIEANGPDCEWEHLGHRGPAPATARGEASSAGEGWRLREGCSGSLSRCKCSFQSREARTRSL